MPEATEEEKKVVEPEDLDDEGDDEDEGDESDVLTIEDEFRELYKEADEQQTRVKKMAAQAEQQGDPNSAIILREVSGTVLGLLKDVIGTCGASFQEVVVGAGLDDDDSRLTVEDAEELYELLNALRKMVDVAKGAAIGDESEDIAKLIGLIDQKREWILEVSDYEPPDDQGTNEAPKALGEA